MVGNGTYQLTFVCTRGAALSLGKLTQYKRDEVLAQVMSDAVAEGGAVVTYTIEQSAFEAGLPFFIEVETNGNASGSYGYVFVKKVK